MSEQISATHGRREDDALKRETRSELQEHGENWREAQSPGEGGPAEKWAPEGRFSATPSGEDRQAVDLRSDLARHLDRTAFPADRAHLRQVLGVHQAEQPLLDLVSSLPADATFASLAELLAALGLPVEERPV